MSVYFSHITSFDTPSVAFFISCFFLSLTKIFQYIVYKWFHSLGKSEIFVAIYPTTVNLKEAGGVIFWSTSSAPRSQAVCDNLSDFESLS